MSLATLKSKFNTLLTAINGTTTFNFSTTVETAYEALVLANVMNEYKRIFGPLLNLTHPTNNKFLNQKPGRFKIDRAFKLDFPNNVSFYVATDIEVFGLEALNLNRAVGILFEADVVVIPEAAANDVLTTFRGYPAPHHIHSAYECKFGSYNKGQLREFLGLKRHLCFLGNHTGHTSTTLFSSAVSNSTPPVALKMARPRRQKFFDRTTATLYDLEQLIIT